MSWAGCAGSGTPEPEQPAFLSPHLDAEGAEAPGAWLACGTPAHSTALSLVPALQRCLFHKSLMVHRKRELFDATALLKRPRQNGPRPESYSDSRLNAMDNCEQVTSLWPHFSHVQKTQFDQMIFNVASSLRFSEFTCNRTFIIIFSYVGSSFTRRSASTNCGPQLLLVCPVSSYFALEMSHFPLHGNPQFTSHLAKPSPIDQSKLFHF